MRAYITQAGSYVVDLIFSFPLLISEALIITGHGGSRAAEYLKEHLFNNLMKHPQFLTDTKLALSALYISWHKILL